jgi:hypothetical protein
MSNDYIGWFSALKHILKGHAGLWSKLVDFYLVFLKLSCVMWMLESLEFEVWTLELHCAACTCAFEVWTLELHCAACTCASRLTVCNFCLLLNMARVASWNLGWGCVWMETHCYCKWAKSFEIGLQLS